MLSASTHSMKLESLHQFTARTYRDVQSHAERWDTEIPKKVGHMGTATEY